MKRRITREYYLDCSLCGDTQDSFPTRSWAERARDKHMWSLYHSVWSPSRNVDLHKTRPVYITIRIRKPD